MLGCNGSLPNGDKGRMKSRFSLFRRDQANGVKPSTVHPSYTPQAAKAISDRFRHSISFSVSHKHTVVVEYIHDDNTDMFQIGRSSEEPIDFIVKNSEMDSTQSTVSRFSCRILCDRDPPHCARVYAAGFDSTNNIVLGERASKWRTVDGQMDALTTNGVLVMNPGVDLNSESAFSESGLSNLGLWREVSVCGNIFTLRETRSDPQRGKRVKGESNLLVDGSLVDLCGVTLLWRSPEGLSRCPSQQRLESHRLELNAGRPQCPVGLYTLSFPNTSRAPPKHDQPWVYMRCGHVHGYHGWRGEGRERECPMCRTRGDYGPLWLGLEPGFYVDSDKPTHALVPCGHVCSHRTALYWSHMHTPHTPQMTTSDDVHTPDEHGFQATCPFCLQSLDTQTPFIHLILQSPID